MLDDSFPPTPRTDDLQPHFHDGGGVEGAVKALAGERQPLQHGDRGIWTPSVGKKKGWRGFGKPGGARPRHFFGGARLPMRLPKTATEVAQPRAARSPAANACWSPAASKKTRCSKWTAPAGTFQRGSGSVAASVPRRPEPSVRCSDGSSTRCSTRPRGSTKWACGPPRGVTCVGLCVCVCVRAGDGAAQAWMRGKRQRPRGERAGHLRRDDLEGAARGLRGVWRVHHVDERLRRVVRH